MCNIQLCLLWTSMGQWCDMEISCITPASDVRCFAGWIVLPVLKLSQNQWDPEITEAEYATVVRLSPTSCIFASSGRNTDC